MTERQRRQRVTNELARENEQLKADLKTAKELALEWYTLKRKAGRLEDTIFKVKNILSDDLDDKLERLNKLFEEPKVCPVCGYPKFKKHNEDFERCHGCNWTSKDQANDS